MASEGIAVVAGDNAELASWLYKAAGGVLMVALTVVVSRIATRATFAAACVGWNPVFAMQFAGSGHNDILMITLGHRDRDLALGGLDPTGSVAVARARCLGGPRVAGPPEEGRHLVFDRPLDDELGAQAPELTQLIGI